MAAAVSLPLPELTGLLNPELDLTVQSSADDLCDQLTLHILDCDFCFSGREHECGTFLRLEKDIASQGSSVTAAAMTF